MGGAVPTRRQKRKSAREISLRAHLCDDWKLRQGGQGCQRGFVLFFIVINEFRCALRPAWPQRTSRFASGTDGVRQSMHRSGREMVSELLMDIFCCNDIPENS